MAPDKAPIWDPRDPKYQARWLEANGPRPAPSTPEERERFNAELEIDKLDTLADLLAAIHHVWTDYVIFPTEHEPVALTLWVAHTYVIGKAECTPYLWVTSAEYESGKTRLLEVAKEVAREPLMASSISAAALFRVIEDREPTLLLDEADAVFSTKASTETAEALRQILNAGYRRGNPAIRVSGQGKNMKVETFSTFSPKAIAGLKTLPRTLSSRCIEIRLDRKKPGETVRPFRIRQVRKQVEWLVIRLEEWSSGVHLPLEPKTTPTGLGDRALDMWEPLFCIAEAAGGEWPARARQAATALAHIDVEDESLNVLVLAHLRDLFDGHHHLHTETILKDLHALDEAPWKDYYRRELTARDLAKLLQPFKVTSKMVRVGERSAKGYERDQLADAFTRYLPPPKNGSQGSQGSQTAPVLTGIVNDVNDVNLISGTGEEDDFDPDYEPIPPDSAPQGGKVTRVTNDTLDAESPLALEELLFEELPDPW